MAGQDRVKRSKAARGTTEWRKDPKKKRGIERNSEVQVRIGKKESESEREREIAKITNKGNKMTERKKEGRKENRKEIKKEKEQKKKN